MAILLVFSGSMSWAANSGITYQGRILKPDGTPLSGQFTQFKMQIRTPNSGSCLMYEEVQSQDLRNQSGQFSLTINDGSGSRTDSTGLTLDRIFANRGTFTLDPGTCSAGPGTYSPDPSDGRDLVVLFKDETMTTWEPIPAQKINFVPFAFESKQIAGFTADSLLRVVDGSGDPLTGLAPLSNAQYNALLDLVNGSSAAYTKAGQLNGVALPTMNSGEVLGWNGTTWVSTTSTPGNNSITTTMLQNGAVDGTKLDSAISILTSGTIGAAVTTTRDFKIYNATNQYVEMVANGSITGATDGDGHEFYKLTWPSDVASVNGQVLTSDTSGNLTWTTPSSAGITDLTGEVTAAGPGSSAATVVSVGGSAAADIHTAELAANAATSLNTPNTIVKRDGTGGFAAGGISATSVTSTGAISGASVAATGAVTGASATFTGAVTQGSVVLKNADSDTVTIQAPTPVTPYVLTLPTSTGGNNQVLTTDGTGTLSWSNPAVTGLTDLTGDVTASGPGSAAATIANNAVTTLKVNDKAITYAKIQDVTDDRLLGRSAGSSGVVQEIELGTGLAFSSGKLTATATDSFAALPCGNGFVPYKDSGAWTCKAVDAANTAGAVVTRDSFGSFIANNVKINSLSFDNAGSAVTLQNPVGSSYTLTLPATTGSNNQVLTTDGAGGLTWTTPATYVSSQWTTHGIDISYDGGGKVGIGTTSPGYKLDVAGDINVTGNFKINGTNISTGASSSGVANKIQLSNGSGGFTTTNELTYDPGLGFTTVSSLGSGTASLWAYDNDAVLQLQGSTNSEVNLVTDGFVSGSKLGAISFGSLSGGRSYGAAITALSTQHHTGAAKGSNLNFLTAPDGSNVPAPRMRIDQNGNVGIGTTSPSYKLDVEGDVNVTGNFKVNGVNLATGGGDFMKNGSVAMTGALQAAAGSAALPSINFGGTNDLGIYMNGGTWLGFSVAGSEVFGVKDDGIVLAPHSLPGAAPNGMIGIDSSDGNKLKWYDGTAWQAAGGGSDSFAALPCGNGYVPYKSSGTWGCKQADSANTNNAIVARDGLGSFAANAATLNSLSLNNAGAIVQIQNPLGSAYTLTLPSNTGMSGQVLTTDGSGLLSWSAPGVSSQWTTHGADISYDGGGNVGIGTTSPGYPLTISSNAATPLVLLQRTSSNNSNILFSNSNYSYYTGLSPSGNFAFGLSNNLDTSPTFAVTQSGKVGVGTSNPGYKLDVNGTVNGTQLCIAGSCKSSWPSGGGLPAADGSASAPTINFTSDTGTGLYKYAAQTLGFATGGYAAAYMSPLEFNASGLDVLGLDFRAYAGDVTGVAYGNDTNRNTGMFFPTNTSLAWATSGAQRMTILSGGNVGIGTTSPTAPLDVKGTIKSSLVSVASPGVSGFDWSKGNIQYTSASCTGATWNFTNVSEGTTYTLVVQGNSHTGTCAFSEGSTFKFNPANAAPTAASDVIYSFMKVGSTIYVSWIDGW